MARSTNDNRGRNDYRGGSRGGNRGGSQGNRGSGQRPAPQRGQPAPGPREGAAAAPRTPAAPPAPKVIEIPATITVRELAERMSLSLIDVIKHLMTEGIMANINQQLDHDIAAMIAEDMGFKIKVEAPPEPEAQPEPEPSEKAPKRTYTDAEKKRLAERPPVVTVMGHVDHGKTALLDAIRETDVAGGEAGGITQRMGAYQVEKQGRKITFIDTPGHAAFTAMRARGAKATDIAVLVVAADDGVMPQTIEAINHAKAAQVPIIVAINKMDKAEANPDLVKQQLSDQGLVVEDWGGDVISVPVSARQRTGIDTLLDMILLVADLGELKALSDAPAKGTVSDARMDRAQGVLATLLIDEGTLRPGDSLVIGAIPGKVRAMFDYKMQRIQEAGPATPVIVLGLPEAPAAGDRFEVAADDRTARTIAAERASEAGRGAHAGAAKATTLDEIFAQIQAGEAKELNLILKTDVQGSIEPIVNSLEKLSTEKVQLKILHTGTGDVSENDVMLAAASAAMIVGFDVTIPPVAAKLAETEGVSIRLYNIIYNLVEDMTKALRGMLDPEYHDVVLGHARVLTTFRIPKIGVIAGAQVTDGKVVRSATVRVRRSSTVLYEGKITSLKRFTEDVREVTTGMEFGIGLGSYEDYQEGDTLEFSTKERVSADEA